ncbi:hypothetical protein BP422_22020 [Brevibacillus formosus]|uniref:Uncharacterized protein n=1 Tax=Brevibacillus formosus TaxID=54913 RepID=A0A220MLH7_9BACL|nr:hypothetical protein [Brevibacillus formosus]ASJ55986.1 hypothetical protein BP422_22020 [Brevibacillus formosus]
MSFHLQQATLRANPAYKLVLYDRLPAEEQKALDELRHDPDFYGFLVPIEGTLAMKAVCRETALLFLTLQNPGSVPTYVQKLYGGAWEDDLFELILDDVIEVEVGGQFHSGAAAQALCGKSAPISKGHIGRLSMAALQYGEALGITKVPVLSRRLYDFNRLPATSEWHRMIPDHSALLAYAGIQPDGPVQSKLQRHWIAVAHSRANGWLTWTNQNPATAIRPDSMIYKLYVSPHPSCLADALAAAIATFTECAVPNFKLGSDLYGILRPDKLIAYFSSLEEVMAVADKLKLRLTGCPAQGVPFTGELESSGLLSWGMDPPQVPSIAWSPMESWRLWITNHLASALIAARLAPATGLSPWEFAMARIRLANVDPETWTPLPSLRWNLPDEEG